MERKCGRADEYENLIFVTKNNRPTQLFIVKETIELCVRNIQKEHPEFERFSPHCLSHTFATRTVENGMPRSLRAKWCSKQFLKKSKRRKAYKHRRFYYNGTVQAGIY